MNKLQIVLAVGTLCALPALGEDLLQIYQDAEIADAQYASARAAYNAGIERLPQARAGLKPQVDLNASVNGNAVKNWVADRSGNFVGGGVTLALTQPLYRLQNNILVDQAEIQLRQVEAQLNQAKQDLILRVSQAYFDVLLAQDNVDVSRAQKAAIAEQLAQAKRNFEVGTATVVDVHEAQARFDLATSTEIANVNDLDVRRRALELLIAKAAPELARLRDSVALPLPTPNDMQQWVKAAEDQNLQVVTLRAGEEIAAKEIDRNNAAYKPTVDLVGSLSDNGNTKKKTDPFASHTSAAQVGVQLNWSIWEGGLRQSRVREALANREKARQDLENARRQAAQSARQSFLGVTSGVAQVKALEQAVVSTQSQLDSTKLGQEVGVRTGIDVLNAQQQLFSSRRDLYSARYSTILNQLRLKFATGLLAPTDLAEVNANLRKPGEAATPAQPPKPAAAPPAAPAAPPAAAPATPAKPAAKPAPGKPKPAAKPRAKRKQS